MKTLSLVGDNRSLVVPDEPFHNEIKEYNASDITHYHGILGEFDYDRNEFMVLSDRENVSAERLVYAGKETDGSRIKIPDGITSCSFMFAGRSGHLIKSMPAIPESVTDTDGMFFGCKELELLGENKLPSNLINSVDMFSGCGKLKDAPDIPRTVEFAENMFKDCKSLENAPSVKTTQLNGQSLFDGCSDQVRISGIFNCMTAGDTVRMNEDFYNGLRTGISMFGSLMKSEGLFDEKYEDFSEFVGKIDNVVNKICGPAKSGKLENEIEINKTGGMIRLDSFDKVKESMRQLAIESKSNTLAVEQKETVYKPGRLVQKDDPIRICMQAAEAMDNSTSLSLSGANFQLGG